MGRVAPIILCAPLHAMLFVMQIKKLQVEHLLECLPQRVGKETLMAR
jgi:hypothetical protein